MYDHFTSPDALEMLIPSSHRPAFQAAKKNETGLANGFIFLKYKKTWLATQMSITSNSEAYILVEMAWIKYLVIALTCNNNEAWDNKTH